MTRPIDVRVRGPLAPFHSGFCTALAAQGYTSLSAANVVRLMAHLSRWLQSRRLQPRELTPDRTAQFLRARRRAGYTCWLSEHGLQPLLDYLRRIQVVPVPRTPVADTPLDQFLDHFGDYLQRERGLKLSTIRARQRVARRFLAPFVGSQSLPFENLTTGDVTRFVLRECRAVSVGYAKAIVSDLRSLLRFLHLEGHTSTALAAAAPPVAGWRVTSLPRGLEPEQVRRLFDGCDRRTTRGRRDWALLLLLVRLGLRAAEVAALTLDDFDWRRGDLLIRGKGRQEERLPVPEDVGEAVVAYLRRARPEATSRALFLSSHAPQRALASSGITSRLRSLCSRAGVPPVGTHRLRYTAATQMLQRGGSLSEVAEVLRHRSLLTTAIYAKVDRKALHALARPWPGGQP